MYFSVRKYIKIASKTYTPCVCYDLPNELVATVEKLQSEGKATIYTEPVGFMNGKILKKEVKKAVKETKKVKKEVKAEEPKKEEEVPLYTEDTDNF